MRWRKGRRSSNVEDRRGEPSPGGGGGIGGGLGNLLALAPFLLRSKTGWLILLALAALYYFGGHLFSGNTHTESPSLGPDAQTAPGTHLKGTGP